MKNSEPEGVESVVQKLVSAKLHEWYGDGDPVEDDSEMRALAALPLVEWPKRAVDELARALRAAIEEVVVRAVHEHILLDQVLPEGALERHQVRTKDVQTLRRGLPRGTDDLDAD